jgi:GNAT superfamily N-acetyltransferase
MQVQTSQRLAREPLQNVELFERAWDECVELQVQDKHTWLGMTLLALSQLDRYEVFVVRDRKMVGALVLAPDPWDVHVGPCMSVFSQYVLPEYRNSGVSLALMREAIRITRSTGAAVLAYTHRTAPWRYETIYRRVA